MQQPQHILWFVCFYKKFDIKRTVAILHSREQGGCLLRGFFLIKGKWRLGFQWELIEILHIFNVNLLFHIIYFTLVQYLLLQTIKYHWNPLTSVLDENAVSFAQAEKLYYETSLISVGNELQSTQNEPGIIYCYFVHDITFHECTQMTIIVPGKHN